MPLDVAAQPGFLASFLGGIVLLSLSHQAMGAGIFRRLLRLLVSSSRVELLQNLVAGFLSVSAFGVILRTFLMTVVILHQPSFSIGSLRRLTAQA